MLSKHLLTCFLLDSYDTGTIGGILAMPYWRDTFSTGFKNENDGKLDVSPEQSSLIVSILSAGTFFGALCASPMGDHVGRRWGLIASNFVFVFGVILQTAATRIPLFTAGRFFAGFGVGLISALSACLPPSCRFFPSSLSLAALMLTLLSLL